MTGGDQPRLSFLLGGHTHAAVTVASFIRDNFHDLAAAGVIATRQRAAARRLQPLFETPSAENGAALLTTLGVGSSGRAFLTHLNGLGPLKTAIGEGLLYPEAEAGAAALARSFPGAELRLVIGVAALPLFFTTAKGPMARAVRKAQWHKLYDLSWADRIEIMSDLLPDATFLILTDEGVARASAEMSKTLFGARVGDGDYFLNAMLIEEGRHELGVARLGSDALLARYGLKPDEEVLKARGIDHALTQLLNDRFAEDIARLARMSQVSVI